MKRFWTGDLYYCTSNGQRQVPWMKEEPPGCIQGSVSYVNFAASLDDGEAITGAIAVHRNWAIGSDDRRAISLFAKEAPQLQRISTLELMKHWVDSTELPADVVRSALRNVRFRAKYVPYSRHPLYHWWRTYMES